MMNCAIIMGPHLENVSSQAARLVEAQGMVVVETADSLAEHIIFWFEHPENKQITAEHAKEFMLANQGAVQRTLSFIMKEQ
jgi:3-deoxy-D-manno-octulosonic-acid transferase